jgi:hypothetical protein
VHYGEPVDPSLDGWGFPRFYRLKLLVDIVFLVGLAAAEGKTIKAYEVLGSPLNFAAQVSSTVLTVQTLLTPLANEEIKVVRCLGLNYSDHAVCLVSLFLNAEMVLMQK